MGSEDLCVVYFYYDDDNNRIQKVELQFYHRGIESKNKKYIFDHEALEFISLSRGGYLARFDKEIRTLQW